MTGLRAAREAAFWDHWRKSLRENPRDGLPAFLDRLEELDAEHAALTMKSAIRVKGDPPLTADAPPPDPEEPKPVRRRTARAPRKAGG